MAENNPQLISPTNSEDVHLTLLEAIRSILEKLNISRVYFVDDAINMNTLDKATFIGLVNSIIQSGKIEQLRTIQIQNAIDFTLDETILENHIEQVWDEIKPGKKLNYYKKVYKILDDEQAINDLNVSTHLTNFFMGDLLQCLTPNEWDAHKDSIISGIEDEKRIMILFDQDLKLAEGRFSSEGIKGEDLILEVKQRNLGDRVIIALFTHTVTEHDEELPKRTEICDRIHSLNYNDFFVLAKSRLEKEDLFADGVKKTCLNTFCESIKTKTIEIIKTAQKNTITKLNAFDTYDFDHTVFKSSFTEGIWEPETLIRITDVIFRDEVKSLMNANNYIIDVNANICAAKDLSDINIKIQNNNLNKIYNEKFKLRHQELYESQALLNELRRPIENGDIFHITQGAGKQKKFILIGQECDLMVRSEDPNTGKRGSKTGILLEIEGLTQDQLLADMKRVYTGQIKKNKFTNHYFAEKFKLDYFENGTNNIGIVYFSKAYIVDLNVLDLIVFNDTGEAVLDIDAPAFNPKFHNYAWRKRYELISNEFAQFSTELEKLFLAIQVIEEDEIKTSINEKIHHKFSFIDALGVQAAYQSKKFSFGIQRVSRLRMPKSKNLLDRYYQHLSRFAELHDFAG